MTEHPETLSLSDFAQYIKRDLSWVCRLRDRDRLVLAADGRVRVAESLSLIAETAGDRADVAARHAEARASGDAPAEVSEAQRSARRAADLRRATAAAALAELELRERSDRVLSREDHLAIVDHVVVTIRESFMALPSRLVPQIEGAAAPEAWPAIVETEVRNTLAHCAEGWRRRAEALRVPMP